MNQDAYEHDARNDIARAIKALAEMSQILHRQGTILSDHLPHIEANIAHLRKITEEARR